MSVEALEGFEAHVVAAVQWLRLLIESIGALVIAVGAVVALLALVGPVLRREAPNFTRVRIRFARYLALALEFQLGADILSTAIAPSWDQIGKLAAIAVIRTALNYFLTREMRDESAEAEAEHLERDPDAAAPAPTPRPTRPASRSAGEG